MYNAFYGLARNPFELSPDPRFYHRTAQHDEALANLCYGVSARRGFIVLTGEVGTGKTLLVRWFISTLANAKTRVSYIVNPRLSADDFLQYVLEDFGLRTAGMKRSEMLLAFNAFLIDLYRNGSTAVLVIDEAHLLGWDLLEDIRLLTNLETPQHKLLQIVLVGQPELDYRLDSQECRQLKQRVALRCALRALAADDVQRYIVTRLKCAGAGADSETLFPQVTAARVAHFSRGIPRLVNTICDGALVAAFVCQSKTVTAELIDEVAHDYHLSGDEDNAPAAKQSSALRDDRACGLGADGDQAGKDDDGAVGLVRELRRIFSLLSRESVGTNGEVRSLTNERVKAQ